MAKAVSTQLLNQVIKGVGTKINPALLATSTGLGIGKKVSVETFGYDFVSLFQKILFFSITQ